jgi:hypothetical protein
MAGEWEKDYRESGVSPRILDDLSVKLQDVKETAQSTQRTVTDVAGDVAVVSKGIESAKRISLPIWGMVIALTWLVWSVAEAKTEWQGTRTSVETNAAQMKALVEIVAELRTSNALFKQAIEQQERRLSRLEDRR